MDEEILTLRETAEFLELSLQTVRRMVERKELPVFKVGGQWRALKSNLAKWMADRNLNERSQWDIELHIGRP